MQSSICFPIPLHPFLFNLFLWIQSAFWSWSIHSNNDDKILFFILLNTIKVKDGDNWFTNEITKQNKTKLTDKKKYSFIYIVLYYLFWRLLSYCWPVFSIYQRDTMDLFIAWKFYPIHSSLPLYRCLDYSPVFHPIPNLAIHRMFILFFPLNPYCFPVLVLENVSILNLFVLTKSTLIFMFHSFWECLFRRRIIPFVHSFIRFKNKLKQSSLDGVAVCQEN